VRPITGIPNSIDAEISGLTARRQTEGTILCLFHSLRTGILARRGPETSMAQGELARPFSMSKSTGIAREVQCSKPPVVLAALVLLALPLPTLGLRSYPIKVCQIAIFWTG
jgi:hypothetical protein